MTEETENYKREVGQCDNCGMVEFVKLGFLPEVVYDSAASPNWLNSRMCTECAQIESIAPSVENIANAEQKIVRAMESFGELDSEEADAILNDDN